jgi:23S rRNA pseudoU1915 N3-methylase RlmH
MNHIELQAEVQTLSMKLRIQGIALRELLRSLPKRQAAAYANRLRASLETSLVEVETNSLNEEADQAVAVELAELLSIVSESETSVENEQQE